MGLPPSQFRALDVQQFQRIEHHLTKLTEALTRNAVAMEELAKAWKEVEDGSAEQGGTPAGS